MTRFELATPATRTRCATKLRHIPTTIFNFQLLIEAQFGYSLLNGSIELSLSIRLPHSKRLSTFFHGRPCHIPTTIFNFQLLIEAQFGYSLLNGSIELSLSIRFLKIPSGSLSWTSFKKRLCTFFTSPFVRLGGFRFASPYGIFACHIPTTIFNFQTLIEAQIIRQKKS